MRAIEIIIMLRTYIATVRIVSQNVSLIAKTTITAENPCQARMMLTRIYGLGNVMCLNEVISESLGTCGIQSEAFHSPQAIVRQVPRGENACAQASQVLGTRPRSNRRSVSSRPIPEPIKHKLIQNKLTTKFLRQSNVAKPTSDDIRIAKDRVEIAQKRKNLDYERWAEEQLRKQKRKEMNELNMSNEI